MIELFAMEAPLTGRVVAIEVAVGDSVHVGQPLAILESMKMEHEVCASASGVVRRIAVEISASVTVGEPLLFLEPAEVEGRARTEAAVDPHALRADLAEVIERHAIGHDVRRPDAVARRRKTGQRTARENVDDLCDAGSFLEYGALALAAQRSRLPMEELIAKSPGDGVVCGIGTVDGGSCMVIAYDYTVFAGTQGAINHKKQDRVLEVAAEQRLPVVLFAEGGGGRPGDTDFPIRPTLDVPTFRAFARLSGLVPLVGVVSGRCFAGNAALLGCCDVIIATENANVGMGGPVMIEGAGLGAFPPEAVGPIDVQWQNGVVDVRVKDEREAVAVAKQYLGYFQRASAEWSPPFEGNEVSALRHIVPENRLRIYDMRAVIAGIADRASVLELRRGFGAGMITALIRVEGRALGVIANEPSHLSGAIDADGADKAARFMQLCDAFGLPVLSLCDTPGFMVGPDAEKTALVRHVSRMFVGAASLEVPMIMVIVRKAYGLGAMAMAGGSMHAPMLTLAWPSGELGAMGLEGTVLLAFKKQLEAVTDLDEREKMVRDMVAVLREQGKAVAVATHVEIDDVIDPADTRSCIVRALGSVSHEPGKKSRDRRRRRFIDTW